MNIILIAVDTLRADHLDCYGYERATSPALQALAEDGVLFENFFAPSIPTDPSFTSLFTGLPDYGHAIAGVIPPRGLPEEAPWLPELFAAAGYQTCALDNLQGHAEFFRRGWEQYSWPDMGRDKKKREKRNGELVTGAATDLMDELSAADPFLVFLHYWDPHTPYFPPGPYNGLYYEGDPTDPRHSSMRRCRAQGSPGVGWVDDDIADADYVVAQYDAEIAYNGEQLWRLFEALKERGLYDETLIVAFSDHGEVLTEHEGAFDHHGLYDANLHVPLIMKLPGAERAGERVKGLTQMTDLPVTLLRRAGLPVPEPMEGADLLAIGPAPEDGPHESLFLGEATWQVKRGVRTREWKFIRAASDTYRHNWHGSAPKELYNLARDPEEQGNLIHTEPEVAAELERRLDRWLEQMQARWGRPDPLVEDGPTLLKDISGRKTTPAADIV